MHEKVYFSNSSGKILSGVLRIPDIKFREISKLPLIIFLHGFNENKDSSLIKSLSYSLASNFATFCFDFSGHGDSQGAFEKHTVDDQIEDIFSSIKFCETFSEIDIDNIIFVGHNIGGDLALLSLENEFIRDKVSCFISLGSKFDLEFYFKKGLSSQEFSNLLGKGYHKGVFDIDIDYYESVKNIDLKKFLTKIKIPTLLVYGLFDKNVKDYQARENYSLIKSKKELLFLETDHQFYSDEIIDDLNVKIREFILKSW